MPTYELRCEECGHRFERFLMRLLHDADRVCSQCGSTKVATGVGGGFSAGPTVARASCAPSGGFS